MHNMFEYATSVTKHANRNAHQLFMPQAVETPLFREEDEWGMGV